MLDSAWDFIIRKQTAGGDISLPAAELGSRTINSKSMRLPGCGDFSQD
jgi:hypothetical protein